MHSYSIRYFLSLLNEMKDSMLQKIGELGGPDDDKVREAYERVGKQHKELQEWVRTLLARWKEEK